MRSFVAILLLPNRPLARMTTSERLAAGEADLATVTTSEAMGALPATAAADTGVPRTDPRDAGTPARGGGEPSRSDQDAAAEPSTPRPSGSR